MTKATHDPTPATLSGDAEDDLLDVSEAMSGLIRQLRALDLMAHGLHHTSTEQRDIAALLNQTDRAETLAQRIEAAIEDIRRRQPEELRA